MSPGRRPRLTVLGSFVGAMTIRVPRLPSKGETLIGSDLDVGPGGKGSNQAIAAARMGADVVMAACVGDDLFGRMALDLWRREGIVLDHVRVCSDAPTG